MENNDTLKELLQEVRAIHKIQKKRFEQVKDMFSFRARLQEGIIKGLFVISGVLVAFALFITLFYVFFSKLILIKD